jgi:hypothetical protein
MQSFAEWNEFHDWEISAVRLSGRDVELRAGLNGTNKVIRFKGVSRCKLDDFVVQNVIYSITIIDQATSPDTYSETQKSLPPLPNLGSSNHQKLAKITSSVGFDGLIEFSEVDVEHAS